MRSLTATEIARNFSKVLDSLENGGEEIMVLRNNNPVAKLIPGASRMNAIEVLGDLYRTLDDVEGGAWIEDMAPSDHLLVRETRDPWA